MRSTSERPWTVVDSLTYQGETELQAILADDPTLIPVADIRPGMSPLCVGVCELTVPGSGSVDILAFSPQGDIAIVECKLISNAEIKRQVIGQVFEYAAFVWQMSYEDLDRLIVDRTSRPLIELVKEKVADVEPGEFRAEVTKRLRSGDFILVIVVEEITDELSRMIEFLNEYGGGHFSVHALEMRRFGAMGTEILVPHLHGMVTAVPTSHATSRGRWTEERFFNAVATNVPDLVAVYRDLFDWMQQHAHAVRFGTGDVFGSFTYSLHNGVRLVPVFYIETSGYLYLTCKSWRAFPVDMLTAFHRQLIAVPGFEDTPLNVVGWPSKRMSIFRERPDALPAFQQALDDFRAQLRRTIHRSG